MFSVRIRILGKSLKKVGMKKIVENNLGPNKARILFLIVYLLIVAYLKLISIEKYFRLRILINSVRSPKSLVKKYGQFETYSPDNSYC